MRRAGKASTGTVATVEAVPAGAEIGIAWVPTPDEGRVGFAFDMDASGTLARGLAKAAAFCRERGFGIADAVESADESRCRLERLRPETFMDRFGGLPVAAGILFDEGGSIGTAQEVFGSADAPDDPANVAARAAMRRAARRASIQTACMLAAAVAAFCAIMTADPSFALTLAATCFGLVGVWAACRQVGKLTARLYARAAAPAFEGIRAEHGSEARNIGTERDER